MKTDIKETPEGYEIDIALPRKEKAIGSGHKDFAVTVDPYIGFRKACQRRDFTINAMMKDVLTGEIIDPYDGRKDLKDKVLRCVDPQTFIEDPLRVLRAAQFASRLEFTVDLQTMKLCRSIDITNLSKERIEEEMKKALCKAQKPSLFFETLKQMEQLDFWFKEVKDLIGIPQDPIYHPEGDVYIHTMEVLDRASSYREQVSNPFYFEMLALCHDFGKTVTTSESNGRIHAYGHELVADESITRFIRRISNENDLLHYVLNMTRLHMKPNAIAHDHSSIKASNRMFDEAIAPEDLIYFAKADRPIRMGNDRFTDSESFLFERYQIYQETMMKPYVTGKDLIDAGIPAGKQFSKLLEYAHKLRLAGIEKESALKQTIAYYHKQLKED